jgi:hypothetical protein
MNGWRFIFNGVDPDELLSTLSEHDSRFLMAEPYRVHLMHLLFKGETGRNATWSQSDTAEFIEWMKGYDVP